MVRAVEEELCILVVGWISFSLDEKFPVKDIHNFLRDDEAFRETKTLKGERGFGEEEERRKSRREISEPGYC